MDQVKEYLRIAIKYRFWIAVGISLLLPLIGYFMGAPKIRQAADDQRKKIESSDSAVVKFASGTLPNKQYAPLVKGRHDELTANVNAAWRFLFARQAKILSWPEKVESRFRAWGRQWPENVDANAVQSAIYDYSVIYPDFVQEVYKTIDPFNYEDGTGKVVAPPVDILLHPTTFDPTKPADLATIWNAQEKLWVQRAMLDVVARVNEKAKTWDECPIKQINSLVVATDAAMDQVSLAKGEAIKDRPKVAAGGAGAEEAAKAAAADAGGAGGGASGGMTGQMAMAAGGMSMNKSMSAMMGQQEGMGGMMGGGMGGGLGGGGSMGLAGVSDDGAVKFIESQHPQFEEVPVAISVMIEQDQVQAFFFALERSPMAIQVKEFQQFKPSSRIQKPEKGKAGSLGGMNMMMGMMSGQQGYGDSQAMMMNMMKGASGRMGSGGGMRSTAKNAPGKGELTKQRKAGADDKEATPESVFDPYFNVVQLDIYGKARLFNTPPAEEKPQSSAATAGAGLPGSPAPGDAATPESTNAAAGSPAQTQPGTIPGAPDAAGTPGTAAAPGVAGASGSPAMPAAPGSPAVPNPAAASNTAPAPNDSSAAAPGAAVKPPEGGATGEPAAPAPEKPAAETPKQMKPDATKPDSANPATPQGDAAKPEAAAKPDAAQGNAAKPEAAAKPDAAQGNAAKPDANGSTEKAKAPAAKGDQSSPAPKGGSASAKSS